MSLILSCLALAMNLVTLWVLWSTERKLRRAEERMERIEGAP